MMIPLDGPLTGGSLPSGAVNCGQAGGNCFCVSMDTGPKAGSGFGLALTELLHANYEQPRWDDVAGRCLACANFAASK